LQVCSSRADFILEEERGGGKRRGNGERRRKREWSRRGEAKEKDVGGDEMGLQRRRRR